MSTVTIEQAKKMPRTYNEMPNEILLSMAIMGDQEAREERLIREIMSVDNVSWADAHKTFMTVLESNRKGLFLFTLPYKIGIAAAVVGAFGSIPMIFDINTVLWFNEIYVTSGKALTSLTQLPRLTLLPTDVPDAKDLETPLEVGSFAWNWMEPPLGTISFFLLCMQYARSQMENLSAKPFTSWFKHRRADRLCKEFPKYNRFIVESFSTGDPFTPANDHQH